MKNHIFGDVGAGYNGKENSIEVDIWLASLEMGLKTDIWMKEAFRGRAYTPLADTPYSCYT